MKKRILDDRLEESDERILCSNREEELKDRMALKREGETPRLPFSTRQLNF